MGRSIPMMVRTWSKSADRQLRQTGRSGGKLTVLHDIANDAKVVKVTTTSLRSERLLESNLSWGQTESRRHPRHRETNLHIVDVVPVPGRAKELVSESQNEQVLDHLLAQVVIDAENLLLLPVRLKRLLELPRGL